MTSNEEETFKIDISGEHFASMPIGLDHMGGMAPVVHFSPAERDEFTVPKERDERNQRSVCKGSICWTRNGEGRLPLQWFELGHPSWTSDQCQSEKGPCQPAGGTTCGRKSNTMIRA
jgi:hypothetical protein